MLFTKIAFVEIAKIRPSFFVQYDIGEGLREIVIFLTISDPVPGNNSLRSQNSILRSQNSILRIENSILRSQNSIFNE